MDQGMLHAPSALTKILDQFFKTSLPRSGPSLTMEHFRKNPLMFVLDVHNFAIANSVMAGKALVGITSSENYIAAGVSAPQASK